MNLSRNQHLVLLVAIALLGAGLRLYTAWHVFPAQGDAGHFVQHGVAYAHGVAQHLSGFWALLPQVAAFCAARMGLDPLKGIQLFSVLCGTIVVFGAGAFAWGLTKNAGIGLLSALFVATNHSLIDISATGLS